jgi:peptidyl-prolyl cis-trans isomerase C
MRPALDIPVVVESASAAAPAGASIPSGKTRVPPRHEAPVAVRVGAVTITEAEIAREMQHHPAREPQQSRAAAARALTVRTLLYLEADRLGIVDEIEPVDQESEEEALIRTLLEREVDTPQPDEADCRRYYEHNAARLHAADRIRVRHILLAAAPDDVEGRHTARTRGEEMIAALRQHPERFTEFTQRHSDCPSRDQGGDLGWLRRGQTTAEFDRQIFMLEEGLAGMTVESRYGHHVVCIDAIERGAPLTFEQARGRIEEYLELQARRNAFHQYLKILEERHQVHGLTGIEAEAGS